MIRVTGMDNTTKQNTIIDIARDTGLSVATVSRALNSNPNVTEATKRRVLASARKLNYSPNENAKTLARGLSDTIGLLLPDNSKVNHLFFSAINAEILRRKMDVLTFNANNSVVLEETLIKEFINRRVGGIIVLPIPGDYSFIGEAMRRPVPLVVIGRFVPDYPVSHILLDFRKGICEAVDHLVVSRQKKRIVQLALKDVYEGIERRKAFEFALKANGIEFDQKPLYLVEDTCESGYEAMKRICDSGMQLDAVICSSDYTAAGAIRALIDRGKKVPDDIAVVGFHNTDISEYYTPRISTVGFDINEFARAAVDNIIAHMRGTPEPKNIGISTAFIQKETT